MTSIAARLLKSAIRLYTYPLRKEHKSLSRSVKVPDVKYTPPKGYTLEAAYFGGVKVEILTPPKTFGEGRDEAVGKSGVSKILHFHGGGYTMGLNAYYRKVAERYAKFSGLTVYTIDFFVGANLRHPALLNDCYAACVGMAESGLPLDDFIAVGDSMGANLMLATCLKLRDEHKTLPRAIVAVSAFTDASASGESYHKNCYSDPMYSLPKNQSFEEYGEALRRIMPYTEGSDLRDSYLSPAFGDYDGFPSMLLLCGDCEVDESDTDMVYDAAKSNGNVTLSKYAGMFHDFLYFAPFLKESKAAWREIIDFIANTK